MSRRTSIGKYSMKVNVLCISAVPRGTAPIASLTKAAHYVPVRGEDA